MPNSKVKLRDKVILRDSRALPTQVWTYFMASRSSEPFIAAIFEIRILWIIWCTWPTLRLEKKGTVPLFLALSGGSSTVKLIPDLQFITKWKNVVEGSVLPYAEINC